MNCFIILCKLGACVGLCSVVYERYFIVAYLCGFDSFSRDYLSSELQ